MRRRFGAAHKGELMKLHRISAAALACVFLLSACQQGDQADEKEDDEVAPVPVETSKPVRGDILAVYSGTAPIEAFAEADVIAKVEEEPNGPTGVKGLVPLAKHRSADRSRGEGC